jgi:hypothetical protein
VTLKEWEEKRDGLACKLKNENIIARKSKECLPWDDYYKFEATAALEFLGFKKPYSRECSKPCCPCHSVKQPIDLPEKLALGSTCESPESRYIKEAVNSLIDAVDQLSRRIK